jgi:hypothetical protein
MCFAATKLFVRNITNSPPIWPVNNRNSEFGVKLYAFRECYEEFPMTIPVSMTDRTGKLTIDKLIVRVDGEWQPLRAWLLNVPEQWLLHTGYRVQTQAVWWERNGKRFPLMRLPAEIRLKILEYAMGDVMHPCTGYSEASSRQVILGPAGNIKRSESEWFRYPEEWSGKEPPNYNLLRVSKQVRAEALQAGWVGTWKHFKWATVCHKVLTCAICPVNLNWLAKVELDFDFNQWFLNSSG